MLEGIIYNEIFMKIYKYLDDDIKEGIHLLDVLKMNNYEDILNDLNDFNIKSYKLKNYYNYKGSNQEKYSSMIEFIKIIYRTITFYALNKWFTFISIK